MSFRPLFQAVVVLVSVCRTHGQLAGDNTIDTEPTEEKDKNDIVEDVRVFCNSEDITLTLTVSSDYFNGMIYPKGLSKNSTCMTEYIQQEVRP